MQDEQRKNALVKVAEAEFTIETSPYKVHASLLVSCCSFNVLIGIPQHRDGSAVLY